MGLSRCWYCWELSTRFSYSWVTRLSHSYSWVVKILHRLIATQLWDLDLAPECLHVVEAEHANVGEQWLEGVAALLLEGQALLDLEQRKDFSFIVVDCSNARIIFRIMQGLKLNYLYLGFNPKKKFISICWFKVLPEGWLLFCFANAAYGFHMEGGTLEKTPLGMSL